MREAQSRKNHPLTPKDKTSKLYIRKPSRTQKKWVQEGNAGKQRGKNEQWSQGQSIDAAHIKAIRKNPVNRQHTKEFPQRLIKRGHVRKIGIGKLHTALKTPQNGIHKITQNGRKSQDPRGDKSALTRKKKKYQKKDIKNKKHKRKSRPNKKKKKQKKKKKPKKQKSKTTTKQLTLTPNSSINQRGEIYHNDPTVNFFPQYRKKKHN